jgi:uncharacterized RDD family membrane protein YckC
MPNLIQIDTPESVNLALEPVGLGSRFLAILVDGAIQWTATIILLILMLPIAPLMEGDDTEIFGLQLGAGIAVAVILVLIALIFFLYKMIFEAAWNGQTPGKRAVGLRVVQSNGLPVQFTQVLIRNLMRVVDFMPVNYLIGSIAILVSERGQRLGDMAAGTVVIRERKAVPPAVPIELSHEPWCDLDRLREHVLRLSEQDLTLVRRYWERRVDLGIDIRMEHAGRIARAIAPKMGWPDRVPPNPEHFLEEILHVRAK